MRALKLGLAATVMMCAFAATAQADCVKVGSVGEAITHDMAKLFATNGLANIMASQGREGRGPVKTSCKDGAGTTTCHASQTGCTAGPPKTCLGAWLCLP